MGGWTEWTSSLHPTLTCYLKAYKKIFYVFDMMLFNVYVLYKITSQKLNYNQFKLVVPEKLNGWTDNAGICETRLSGN
jgi:hypothetical protein